MKTVGIVVTVLFSLLVVPLFILVVLWLSAVNGEQGTRNNFNAQVKSNESSFDQLWKTISQEASIAQTERESFRKTYSEIMKSTQGVAGNGSMASFLTQAGVNVTPELFSKLMNVVEAQRESFDRDQKKLIQIKKQHDDICLKYPSKLFVGGVSELELKLVTSDRTDKAFESGKDENVELFKKED